MPHYFFHIRKDSHPPDEIGVDLPDLSAARREAAILMGRQITAHPDSLWTDEEWHIEAADATGLILFVIYSAAMRSSAAPR